MKITKQDKDAVLAVLAANPKASTEFMFHSDLVEKTGFTSPKVSAIRKELVDEGRIREMKTGRGLILIFLVMKDKRQQILDLLKERDTRDTTLLGIHTGQTKEQVHGTCLQLINEGLLEVVAMVIKPSRQLIEQQKEREVKPGN